MSSESGSWRRARRRERGSASAARTSAAALVLAGVAGALVWWAGSGWPDGGQARASERGRAARAGSAGTASAGAASEADGGPPPDLDAAFRDAERIASLTSLLVSRDGALLGERYYHGGRADEVVNVKSVSKSVLSALVGVALGEGAIRSVDEPVSAYLDDYLSEPVDPRKRKITLGQLLSMEAGLETTSFDSYGAWVTSSDWIRAALDEPMECAPGQCWEYSTGNYHLLSVVLTRATGVDTRTYAARKLLGPLGIPARPWDRGPKGYYLGGNNMGFTPRELLRFGELYLAEGRREGRQVVPADWIRRSWEPRAVSSWNGNDYGYGWWGRRIGGERVHYAWGYGGQYLFLVPRLELAVVATTDPGRARRGWDADRAIVRLLREEILPPVRAASMARR